MIVVAVLAVLMGLGVYRERSSRLASIHSTAALGTLRPLTTPDTATPPGVSITAWQGTVSAAMGFSSEGMRHFRSSQDQERVVRLLDWALGSVALGSVFLAVVAFVRGRRRRLPEGSA